MNDQSPNSWEARADAATFYGFTDLPSVKQRGAVVLTHVGLCRVLELAIGDSPHTDLFHDVTYAFFREKDH